MGRMHLGVQCGFHIRQTKLLPIRICSESLRQTCNLYERLWRDAQVVNGDRSAVGRTWWQFASGELEHDINISFLAVMKKVFGGFFRNWKNEGKKIQIWLYSCSVSHWFLILSLESLTIAGLFGFFDFSKDSMFPTPFTHRVAETHTSSSCMQTSCQHLEIRIRHQNLSSFLDLHLSRRQYRSRCRLFDRWSWVTGKLSNLLIHKLFSNVFDVSYLLRRGVHEAVVSKLGMRRELRFDLLFSRILLLLGVLWSWECRGSVQKSSHDSELHHFYLKLIRNLSVKINVQFLTSN